MVIFSKILAAINIFLSIVVLYVSYISMREYFDFLEPKGVASANHIQIMGGLFSYALIMLIASILFLFSKQVGWWLTIIIISLVVLANILSTFINGVNVPMSINSRELMPVIIFTFYVLLIVINLSKPVRKHFKNIEKT